MSVMMARAITQLRGLSAPWAGPLRPLFASASALPTLSSAPQHLTSQRHTHTPPTPVYGGPATRNKRFTLLDLQKKYHAKQPISMVTAYTYPSACHVDAAGIDILLVGDSLAMVELGYDTTLPVSMDEMLYHCQSVARGAKRPLIVGDMPFGSYEESPSQGLRNAVRFLKEGNVDVIKMEGGKQRAETVRKIVSGGISVMGHVGLTPQSISVLGGFRPQGKTAEQAKKLVEDALALQEAGAFAIVLECVPESVASLVTSILDVPTIGIGAGAGCSGQVLVYHDLLGMLQHPHHAKVAPKFCKRYAQVGNVIQEALEAYREDVEKGTFPSKEFSPYKIPDTEYEKLVDHLEKEKLI